MTPLKRSKLLNPSRYIMLLSIGVKALCLLSLLAYWNLLAELGWFRWFVLALLVIFIGVQGTRLRRIW